MTSKAADKSSERLNLRSSLSDLALVSPWIDALALEYGFPARMKFAMNLCLEEVLSNIIRHGFSGQPNHTISVRFARPKDGYFIFMIDDDALPFNPLTPPELPAINLVDQDRVGGQGIRLLRRFSDTIEYRPTQTGNQLTIGFVTAGSAVATAERSSM